ncbi:site-specific integrase [Neorhizobium sp. T25_27]|uniref:tyrosine-type recombinase/integrase n=1 Tax=Neorhizobium sp. T25_27 TaxID=2093831 RepID=UPI00155E2680|nr:site-specific integrase [Neorhizobium sp. T25_27]
MSRPHGLTESRIENLPPPRNGKRYDVPDGDVPNLFVRVGPRQKTFVLLARFERVKNSTRRVIGVHGRISLDEARAIASDWNALVKRGLDPKKEKERQEEQEELARRHTFASVMEDYIAELPDRERNKHVPQDIAAIRREMLDPRRNPWLELPMSEVRALHVSKLVKDIRARPAPAAAHVTFRLFKTFFTWLMDPDRQLAYGLDPDNPRNPIRDLKAAVLGLHSTVRDRILHKNEVLAYWRAADETPYPYGPFFQALLLTGVRKAELTGMRWSEIDWDEKLWTVPNERFKAGTQHLVPLSDAMIDLLQKIRGGLSYYHGDCVFSTTNGQLPVSVAGAMDAFRARVSAELAEISPGVNMERFVMHDDRRVVRTNLAALKIPEPVIDTILGHGKKGLKRIYDQYRYLDETAEALSLWADRLEQLITGARAEASPRAEAGPGGTEPPAKRRRR